MPQEVKLQLQSYSGYNLKNQWNRPLQVFAVCECPAEMV